MAAAAHSHSKPLASNPDASRFVVSMLQSTDRIKVSLSHGFHNKTPLNQSAWAHDWQAIDITPEVLVQHVKHGKAFCPAYLSSDHRTSENFVQAEILPHDLDHAGLDVDDLLQIPFIRQYAFFIYRTPSWTPEAPRCRVLYRLDQPITRLETYKHYASKLLFEFGEIDIDKCSKVPVQIFFGSTQPNYYFNPDAFLPLAVLDAMPEPTRKADPIRLSSKAAVETFDLQAYFTEIERALGVTHYNGNGWSNAVPCPFHEHEHDDTRPRASWNRNGNFLHCLKCQRSYNASKTGAALHISCRKADFTKGLHTSTAERLLSIEKGKHDQFTRVLWALMLCGVEAGETFSEREAVELLKPLLIGRKAIRTALKTAIQTEKKLLVPFGNTVWCNAKEMYPKGTSRLSQGKPPRHNTKQFYEMPSEAMLCEALDVIPIGTDVITLADLKSTKTLRMALNRALVKREKEIQISQRQLGKRLGVTRKTIHLYVKQDRHIQSRPGEPETKRLTLSTVENVPDDAKFAPGCYLQVVESGERRPPHRKVALQLLDMGFTVYFVKLTPNIYTYLETPAGDERKTA